MGTTQDFINTVKSAVGTPYLWGGTDPFHGGADCSGLLYWAAAQCGLTIARTSQAQWETLPHVASPQPGDLVFFNVPSDGGYQPAHVGMYVWGGEMIEDPYSGADCRYSPIPNGPGEWVIGYARIPFPAPPPPPAPPKPPPPPPPLEEDMLDHTPSGNGYWILHPDGSVWSYGDATYLGGLNPGAPVGGGAMPAGVTAVSLTAHPTQQGYWIRSSNGGVYAFGAAQYHGAS